MSKVLCTDQYTCPMCDADIAVADHEDGSRTFSPMLPGDPDNRGRIERLGSRMDALHDQSNKRLRHLEIRGDALSAETAANRKQIAALEKRTSQDDAAEPVLHEGDCVQYLVPGRAISGKLGIVTTVDQSDDTAKVSFGNGYLRWCGRKHLQLIARRNP